MKNFRIATFGILLILTAIFASSALVAAHGTGPSSDQQNAAVPYSDTDKVVVSGRVTAENGRGVQNAAVVLTDTESNRRTAITNVFGVYSFEGVETGQSYVIGVAATKSYRVASRVVNITGATATVNFTARNNVPRARDGFKLLALKPKPNEAVLSKVQPGRYSGLAYYIHCPRAEI